MRAIIHERPVWYHPASRTMIDRHDGDDESRYPSYVKAVVTVRAA